MTACVTSITQVPLKVPLKSADPGPWKDDKMMLSFELLLSDHYMHCISIS